jgi:multicomponent Na+:H+ antiporter subunit E
MSQKQKTFRSRFNLFAIMFVLWMLLNLRFDLYTVFFGLVIASFVAFFSYDTLHDRQGLHFKGIPFHRIVFYFVVLSFEIFKSAFMYVINLFNKRYVPVIFRISLKDLDPVKVAIVANSITLTPGTISVEMIDRVLYVMVLADPETPHSELEKPIRERFEKLLRDKEDRHERD